jgi:hypothetical protein
MSYQWQQSTDNSTWTTVSGATSSTLSLTSVSSSQNGYYYRCQLSANLSLIYSSSAQLTVNSVFTPTAVLLASGTSYTVPSGATTMKAWAVGAGNIYSNAGGCAYKTWSVSGGSSVTYSVGLAPTTLNSQHTDATVTYGGVTITGYGASVFTPGGYSGGDGGANGGGQVNNRGGAVGGNGTVTTCGRVPMTDVSGLKAAVALAGGNATESCGSVPAFGSGGRSKYETTVSGGGGYGGGSGTGASQQVAGASAVVLYFT